MKKGICCVILMVCLTLCGFTCMGQQLLYGEEDRSAWPFPLELNGTMMTYNFNGTDSTAPWGKEMTPIFINYIARHGARFLSSEKKIDKLRKELSDAEKTGNISKAGKDFLTVIQKVDSVTDGNWGALNPTGMQEEQMLGKEMFSLMPNLLREGRIEARATYVPRVVMTMYELCHELTRQTPDIEITAMEGKQFNSLLRYFKTDSTYGNFIGNGPWLKTFEEYSKATVPCSPAAKLFLTPPDDDKLRKLTLDMYGVLQSLPASGLSARVDEWFTEREFKSCWNVDNLKHYYQRSASKFSDIPALAATPLLQDIIRATDDAIAGEGDLKASLLFGHAETVIPLFSLMRLPGCYAPDCTPAEVAEEWKDYAISPLGANLMMVVLRNAGDEFYVALRLNGEWISIDGEEIIRWDKLKSTWISFMEG